MADGREPVDLLLVEDNPGDVRLTREALDATDLAYTLHVVDDGSEALEFYRRRGEYATAPRPDLVLLDLSLPQTNGEAVLEEIRDDPALRSIPVVVFSGSDSQKEVTAAYERGANAYLAKPVDPEEFVDDIEAVVGFWFSTVQLPN